MTNPLISIIVPIYNVEKYLPTCLDSILAQTYKNLEIILVNDGSTDNSGAICDEYAARNVYGGGASIVAIHQENGGVASARNTGLDRATGDYIGFVDPDDWIEPNMYEVMLNHIEKGDHDGAMCSMLYESPNKTEIRRQCPTATFKQPELFRLALEDKLPQHMVRLLVKHSAWNDVRFNTDYRRSEDWELLPRLLRNCNSLITLSTPLYHYRLNESSITHQGTTPQSRYQDFILFRNRLQFCRTSYPDSIDWTRNRTIAFALSNLRYLMHENQESCSDAQDMIAFLQEESQLPLTGLSSKTKFHLLTYFHARPIFHLYTKFFFWNRARVNKRRQKKLYS